MSSVSTLATDLVADMAQLGYPGMSQAVAVAWISREGVGGKAQQPGAASPTNPLGIRCCPGCSGSGLETECLNGYAVYNSDTSGMRAAAYLLAHNPAYAKVLTAIRSGVAADQAAALIQSPWDATHYGGALGGWSASGGTGSGASSGSVQLEGFCHLVSFPVGHVLTAADVDHIISTVTSDRTTLCGQKFATDWSGVGTAQFSNVMKSGVGMPWSQSFLSAAQKALGGTASSEPGANIDIPGAIAALPGEVVMTFVPVVVNLILLGLTIRLGYLGIQELMEA